MIPRAKKNLHECEYHFNKMLSSRCLEEFEINFAAFVNSARNVTFVLQAEFKNHSEYKEKFLQWYGNPDSESPIQGTKLYEMRNDDLLSFFKGLRDQIVKEGINGFACTTFIRTFNSPRDLISPPPKPIVEIGPRGIYYLVNKGTAQEDLIPAITRAELTTSISIPNPPRRHLGQTIPENLKDVINLSKKYYQYLKNLVEEWTGILNNVINP